jgi:hypothetical protein
MAEKLIWTVKVSEARSREAFLASRVAADSIDKFSVTAGGSDEAKRLAKDHLEVRGHSVRACNISAKETRTVIVYVAPGSSATVAARQKRPAPSLASPPVKLPLPVRAPVQRRLPSRKP